MPLSIRFRPHDKREERKKREFKEDEVMHKTMDLYSNRKKGKCRRRHKIKSFERTEEPRQMKIKSKLDTLLGKSDESNEEIHTIDFLLNKDNYYELMDNISVKIDKQLKSKINIVVNEHPPDIYFDDEEDNYDISVDERGFRWDINNDESVYEDDDSNEEEESKYNPFSRGGNTAFTLEGEKALLDYFNEIKKKVIKIKEYQIIVMVKLVQLMLILLIIVVIMKIKINIILI